MTQASHQDAETAVDFDGSNIEALAEPAEPQDELIDRMRREIEALRQEVDRLSLFRHLAYRDELTGLYNRRHFDERLVQEWSRASRCGTELALVIIDLDDFKEINDQAGHAVGDEVLAFFGDVLASSCREYDTPHRLGGDEFAYILPETDRRGAETLIGRVLDKLVFAPGRPQLPGGSTIRLSHGIAELHEARSSEELFALADAAMYARKRARQCRQVDGRAA